MSSDELLQQVHTTSDLRLLLREIDTLHSGLYRTANRSWEELLRAAVRPQTARIAATWTGDKGKILDAVKTAAQRLRVLRLTLGFVPPQALVEELAGWVKQHVAANVILDVSFDPLVVGGAVVDFEGKYADLSLRPALDQVLVDSHERILKLLKHDR